MLKLDEFDELVVALSSDAERHVNATVNENVTITCPPLPDRGREIPNFHRQLKGDDRAKPISYNGTAIKELCQNCTLDKNGDYWNLRIRDVQPSQSGNYTCTYSDGSHHEFTTLLTVTGKLVFKTSHQYR